MDRIYTQRLILRPFEESDLEDLFLYAQNPDVGPNAGWEPHADREASFVILQKFIEEGEVWALEERESGHVIGSLGLHKTELRRGIASRSMGYVLAKPRWGRGLMTEAARAALGYAFESMQMEIVEIEHFTFNLRSRRVIEKLGFTYEGTLRRAWVIPGGVVADEALYSMTREEYAQISEKW